MTQEPVGSNNGRSQDSRAPQGLQANKKIRLLSNVSSENQKKLKFVSRAISNKSENAVQTASDNGSTQFQTNKPIKLGNFKKLIILNNKDGIGGTVSNNEELSTPNDQEMKKGIKLNLPPRITTNKTGTGQPLMKLKIRTSSEEPNVIRCQSV